MVAALYVASLLYKFWAKFVFNADAANFADYADVFPKKIRAIHIISVIRAGVVEFVWYQICVYIC